MRTPPGKSRTTVMQPAPDHILAFAQVGHSVTVCFISKYIFLFILASPTMYPTWSPTKAPTYSYRNFLILLYDHTFLTKMYIRHCKFLSESITGKNFRKL